MDFMKVFDQTVREIKREVNLKVLKVPEIEQKILSLEALQRKKTASFALCTTKLETGGLLLLLSCLEELIMMYWNTKLKKKVMIGQTGIVSNITSTSISTTKTGPHTSDEFAHESKLYAELLSLIEQLEFTSQVAATSEEVSESTSSSVTVENSSWSNYISWSVDGASGDDELFSELSFQFY